MTTHTDLIQRLRDESDLCANEGAGDIAALLDEAAKALDAPKPEFCCELAWGAARSAAWKAVNRVSCGCDPHVEYCMRCWPLDFREDGKWDDYKGQ